MEVLYILYTYNRPTVLRECLRTLLANNDLKPDRLVIIDDGSQKSLKQWLAGNPLESSIVVDLVSFGTNVGYGRAAEIGFALADMFRPRYCFFIESDYIFRKHGLDEVMEVFRSPLGRTTAAVAGYSHPDFFNPAVSQGRYPSEMTVLHGRDNLNRAALYRPFPFTSSHGELQLQFVSNSCGTIYLNWQLISQIRQTFYPVMDLQWIHGTCSRGQASPILNDAILSQTLAYYWMEYALSQGWNTDACGPLVDIIPSVANHLSGEGLNAPSMQEGQTSVGSPSFPRNYDEYPRPGVKGC